MVQVPVTAMATHLLDPMYTSVTLDPMAVDCVYPAELETVVPTVTVVDAGH